MDNEQKKVDEKIIINVMSEIDDIKSIDDKINTLNKLISKNLLAIYDAVTEINLSDKESYERVKELAAKQKCYESIRKRLISEQRSFDSKTKR